MPQPLQSGRRGFLAGAAATLAAPMLPRLARAGGAMRFENDFGETVLQAPAKRVVSLGFNTHDGLLALGVVPVGLRYWYGKYDDGIWPWAHPYIGDAKPMVMRGETSAELVAGLAPDLIIGMGAGMGEAEYNLLSQIAPVLLQPKGTPMWGIGWQTEMRLMAKATGKEAKGEALIKGVSDKFAAMRARHPDWQGATAALAWHDGGQTGVYLGGDTRRRFFKDLGFVNPPAYKSLKTVSDFYATLSPEDLSPLDADVLVWLSTEDRADDLVNMPMRKTLKAPAEGREIFAGSLMGGALSFGTVLSMPYAMEMMEPEITAAMDGDPATKVPASVKAGLVA